jgi:hypothetical protein|tara:strand:- start:78 stop:797 length:720 start_codon:yes stop_codon:yes gene_type:complete
MNNLYLKSLIKKLIKSKHVSNIFPQSGIIFIHIPKTGGTSLRKLLIELEDGNISHEDKKKYYYAEELKRKNISSIHGKAKHYLQVMNKELWDKSLKFTSVRNPWDLMVSSYHWWLQHGHQFPRLRQMYADISLMSFKDYLKSPYGNSMINECVGNVEDWIFDKNKNMLLDGLVRLENFDEDFNKLVKKFNKSFNGLNYLTKINVTNRKRYQEYYDLETQALVEKRFKFLIDHCGYSYDS